MFESGSDDLDNLDHFGHHLQTKLSRCDQNFLIDHIVWTPYDWLNKFYSCYMASVVIIPNGCGLGIGMHRRHQPHKS